MRRKRTTKGKRTRDVMGSDKNIGWRMRMRRKKTPKWGPKRKRNNLYEVKEGDARRLLSGGQRGRGVYTKSKRKLV